MIPCAQCTTGLVTPHAQVGDFQRMDAQETKVVAPLTGTADVLLAVAIRRRWGINGRFR